MAFRFERDETVARALPRLARKAADNALDVLAGKADAHEQVHEARTSVKKIRGLLRLARPALGKTYATENRKLRDLADRLSALRDAEVLVKTFDGLFDHFEGQLGEEHGPVLRRVRTRLITRLRGVEQRMDLPERLREAARSFKKVRKRARRWTPARGKRDGGWGALAGGLEETYARARLAGKHAYRSGRGEDFHDWRKAVKYHGYHLRYLGDLFPAEIDARLAEVDALGDLLGREHDLTVFAETLVSEPRCFDNKADRDLILGLVERRRKQLRREARPYRARLFAEPPAAFTRRMHHYWRAWRSGPGRAAAKAAKAAKKAEDATPPAPRPRRVRPGFTELVIATLLPPRKPGTAAGS